MSNPIRRNPTDWHRQRKIAHLALAQFGFADARVRLLKYADGINIRAPVRDGRRFVLRMHPITRHPLKCLRSNVTMTERVVAKSDTDTPLAKEE